VSAEDPEDLRRLQRTKVCIQCNLQRADLSQADLQGIILRRTTLKRANLRGADLRFAILRDVNFNQADLTDADLTGAILKQVSFKGAILNGARLPVGFKAPPTPVVAPTIPAIQQPKVQKEAIEEQQAPPRPPIPKLPIRFPDL
jgi:hypothetical protein